MAFKQIGYVGRYRKRGAFLGHRAKCKVYNSPAVIRGCFRQKYNRVEDPEAPYGFRFVDETDEDFNSRIEILPVFIQEGE